MINKYSNYQATVIFALCRNHNVCLAQRPRDPTQGNANAARMLVYVHILSNGAEVECFHQLEAVRHGDKLQHQQVDQVRHLEQCFYSE